jgi:hypothetical protein
LGCDRLILTACRYLREHPDARTALVTSLVEQGVEETEAEQEVQRVLGQTSVLDESASPVQVLRAPSFDDVREAVRTAAAVAHSGERSAHRVLEQIEAQLESYRGTGPEAEAARAYLLKAAKTAQRAEESIKEAERSAMGTIHAVEELDTGKLKDAALGWKEPVEEAARRSYAAAREAFVKGDATEILDSVKHALDKPIGAPIPTDTVKRLLELDLTDEERAQVRKQDQEAAQGRKEAFWKGVQRIKEDAKRGLRSRVGKRDKP